MSGTWSPIPVRRATRTGPWTLLALACVAIAVPPAVRTSAADPLFAVSPPYVTGIHPQSVAIGDLNRDGLGDLVVANIGTQSLPGRTVSVLLGRGLGFLAAEVAYATGSQPSSVALGDLNRDGKLDVVVADAGSNTVSVLLGNGDGSLRPRTDFGTGSYAYAVAIGDLEGTAFPTSWWRRTSTSSPS